MAVQAIGARAEIVNECYGLVTTVEVQNVPRLRVRRTPAAQFTCNAVSHETHTVVGGSDVVVALNWGGSGAFSREAVGAENSFWRS